MHKQKPPEGGFFAVFEQHGTVKRHGVAKQGHTETTPK